MPYLDKKFVKKSRIDKICACCNLDMPKGTSNWTVSDPEDYESRYHICTKCSDILDRVEDFDNELFVRILSNTRGYNDEYDYSQKSPYDNFTFKDLFERHDLKEKLELCLKINGNPE